MKIFLKTLIIIIAVNALAGCASKKVSDISYLTESKALITSFPKLDVYSPRKAVKKPVVIFIHGGYWESGKKETYRFFGRNLARKDVVTVVPNYTLSPDGDYNTMAQEVAEAIQWTHDSISEYGGDSTQIFLMGHSAGGHLIALVGTNSKYLENTDIIKGIILNDAAGLDMYSYLKKYPPTEEHNYDVTWTKDENNWKEASPIYSLNSDAPPFLIYVGTESYPSIITSNQDFETKLKTYQPNVKINYLEKGHVAMMGQLFWASNDRYDEILSFIHKN